MSVFGRYPPTEDVRFFVRCSDFRRNVDLEAAECMMGGMNRNVKGWISRKWNEYARNTATLLLLRIRLVPAVQPLRTLPAVDRP